MKFYDDNKNKEQIERELALTRAEENNRLQSAYNEMIYNIEKIFDKYKILKDPQNKQRAISLLSKFPGNPLEMDLGPEFMERIIVDRIDKFEKIYEKTPLYKALNKGN